MACGLFGKIPAKRDFIAVDAPQAFLSVYEPWLQGGLTASRLSLGGHWQDAFLKAPIWRFWLGAGYCGRPVAGAFMPSVDGVGRYFPLTVFSFGEAGAALAPPELDPQEAWFAVIEDFLLHALEPGTSFEALSQRLKALPPPATPSLPPPGEAVRLSDGTIVAALAPGTLPVRLPALRVEDHLRAQARACCLWTIGGEEFEPLLLAGQALPDPHLFAGLLTGRFDAFVQGIAS